MVDDVEDLTRSLVRTLTVFGATSVAAGGVLALAGKSPGRRAFGQQTAAWGAINLAIAGVSGLRPPPEAKRLRRVLLVNAGLDVGYVAAGAHMVFYQSSLRGRLTPDQARGHGLAIVVQGAFLFALDSVYARRASSRATRRGPAVSR